MAGLATYDGASSNFENVTAGFSTKTQKHLFTRDNYTFGSVLGELKDELNLTGANFGKTDFSDDYSSGLINVIGYSQATASIDNEYQHNSGEFIKVNGYYQNSGFFIPYFIDDDKTFVTDTFDKVYNYDELVGNNKYFNLNDYVDLSYKYAFGMQKEGNYNHEYSSKNGGQTFYFVKDGNKSETATHTISIEAPMGKIEADDNFDLGYIADEEPDPDMGRIDESDLYFDSDFDNKFNVDYEYEKAPSTADSYHYRGPQKKQKTQKTFSDIIENKKVVLMQKQRSTSLSFQNNYSVVQDIISKSLLASLSLLEDPNKFLANSNDDSDKEEEIS